MSNIDKQALTDEAISKAFAGTNFGRDDFKNILAETVIDAAAGWRCGYTATTICTQLGLLTPKGCASALGLRFISEHVQRETKRLKDELEAADKLIAELEARRVPDSFNIIGENIRTQDNRITSEPMFCVFQKREIVVDEDYDCDRIVWVDEEGCEATERQRMRLELLHGNCRETPDKWRRIAVKDIDDFVTCCFTEQGCRDYLASNGHNLRLPFIYVKSGFRNAEFIGIRNWLAGTRKGE